jgi:hypothetical protein
MAIPELLRERFDRSLTCNMRGPEGIALQDQALEQKTFLHILLDGSLL